MRAIAVAMIEHGQDMAFLHFGTEPNRAEIPETCLHQIVERLQPAWRRTSGVPLHPGQ